MLHFRRGVVKAILKLEDSDVVMDLMKVCLHKKRTIFGYSYETPLRMLIKDMPGNTYISLAKLYLVFLTDMAKHFLDLCAEMYTNGKLTMSTPQLTILNMALSMNVVKRYPFRSCTCIYMYPLGLVI